MDHFRIATTYAEADPAGWGGTSATPTPTPTTPAGGTLSGCYRITPRHSGKDMTVQSASTAEGANIFQWPYGGSNTNDEWAIVDVGGGYRRITSRHSGKSAEVVGSGTADGTNVAQRTYSGATHQQFQFVSVP